MTGPTASRLLSKPPRIRATSFLIDGEAVIVRYDGTPDFHALRSQHRGHEAVLVAFDLIERDGEDLRDLPLIERKRRAPASRHLRRVWTFLRSTRCSGLNQLNMPLALQLLFWDVSESMGNHDSEVVDASSVD